MEDSEPTRKRRNLNHDSTNTLKKVVKTAFMVLAWVCLVSTLPSLGELTHFQEEAILSELFFFHLKIDLL